MSTQSGIFTFDDHVVILTQGADGVWAGERRSAGLTRAPSGLVATFDGRIDNLDELRTRLGVSAPGALSEADIALAVFDRWRSEGLASIVGEWSVVVWDEAQ